MLNGARILVVDDEPSMREFLEILLVRQKCKVDLAAGGQQAIDLLGQKEFDVVITDLKMPRISGLDVLRAVREKRDTTEVILVTAFATAETAISAMKEGAYDYLTKPFKVDEIVVTIERALEKRRLVQDNAALRQELSGRVRLGNLIGRSAAMQQVFALIRKVADTKTSVLISGESGTGKELVARAIHSQGKRADKPFIAVNCGAIPDTLMESELFGHVRGAFTGAVKDKDGLFVAADQGTLFLDEIGELSPPMQVKLLRALQERRIKPVGGVHEILVNVRVLAATNRDLDEEVEANRFRSDLFYRLNVIPLLIPPLRQRREDIPLLVNHFVRHFAAQMEQPVQRVTADAMSQLCRYHFPGNVRELENLIERAVTLASDDHIDVDLLPELRASKEIAPTELPETGIDLDRHMAEIERSWVESALERTDGNRTEAAKLLGISLRSLRYRLAKHAIYES
jgi:two-component system response regulator PilR (NtrC family)